MGSDAPEAKEEPSGDRAKALVASVGGSPEPIIATLLALKPASVCFVVSEATRVSVTEQILPKAGVQPQYEFLEVADPQSLLSCYETLAKGLPDWLARNRLDPTTVTVDYTGGTKTMTVALALVGVSLFRRFRYVGGIVRDKAGVGVVQSGHELPVESVNPSDFFADGRQREAARLMGLALASSAAAVLDSAAERCGEEVGPRLRLLAEVCNALDMADRFDFEGAHRKLAPCSRTFGFLAPSAAAWEALRDGWQRAAKEIRDNRHRQTGPNPQLKLEWIANADRRRVQGRHDTAVALLYRVCELHAQDLLHERFGANFGRIPADALDSMAVERTVGPPRHGEFRLGVEAALRLLGMDEAYERLRGHLQKRNDSALAHGVRPCEALDYDAFRQVLLPVLGLSDSQIPRWPSSDFLLAT